MRMSCWMPSCSQDGVLLNLRLPLRMMCSAACPGAVPQDGVLLQPKLVLLKMMCSVAFQGAASLGDVFCCLPGGPCRWTNVSSRGCSAAAKLMP